MAVVTRLMSAAELLRMPPDNYRYELVRGELIRITPAGARHGRIAIKLGAILEGYVLEHQLGVVCAAETGFLLERDPDTVRAPDVSFIIQARIPADGIPDEFWPFAPDLAVEVISPGDTVQETETKVFEYLEAGTSQVWVANPKTRRITVYRSPGEARILTGEDTLDGADVVPGLVIPVKAIFE